MVEATEAVALDVVVERLVVDVESVVAREDVLEDVV